MDEEVTEKNIVVCTAKYSDNLGDGVIAECVSHILQMSYPDIKISEIDIAGRIDYSPKSRIMK